MTPGPEGTAAFVEAVAQYKRVIPAQLRALEDRVYTDPWFGGKSRAAGLIWSVLGDVDNYVEPFFGSGAVLLGRPKPGGIVTVNDIDGHLVNVWRALSADPEAVAGWCDWPVTECDLTARHLWLVQRRAACLEPGSITSRKIQLFST